MEHLKRANYGHPDQVYRQGGLQVSATPYRAGDALPWHEHDEAYLCLVAAGTYVQQSSSGDMDCAPGLLLSHPQGHRHANRFGPRGARCISIFLTEATEGTARLLSEHRQLRLPDAGRLLDRIEKELRATDDAASLALQSAVLELVALACRAQGERRPAWLQRVLQRLHDDPLATPTLQELALLAGVHPSHLARSFQRAQGSTIGDYQRGLRIELARQALGDTRRSIADVAALAGFSDQSHFARVFKRVTGDTPRDYRHKVQRAS
ncbi:AraC family transcriptional regulator [Dyella jiangningensis]|uniref:helix-turn-helix transcriptional regulator n=1 Tax=Dyella jiangningensis TaxID=1379159 RepID=UPI00240FF291|nr:AraC family transcriptional regulator [Dyella jiangningensis]MDG2539537.1 AraC family transcriptional regulator [Dyella jiangningensis]